MTRDARPSPHGHPASLSRRHRGMLLAMGFMMAAMAVAMLVIE